MAEIWRGGSASGKKSLERERYVGQNGIPFWARTWTEMAVRTLPDRPEKALALSFSIEAGGASGKGRTAITAYLQVSDFAELARHMVSVDKQAAGEAFRAATEIQAEQPKREQD